MLYLINPLSIHREAVLPDIDHTKNLSNKLLHHNQSYFQLNRLHPAIPASKVHRQTSRVNLNIFQYLQEDHHVIQHKVKAASIAMRIVAELMFLILMHQVAVLDNSILKIQHHLLEVSEVM